MYAIAKRNLHDISVTNRITGKQAYVDIKKGDKLMVIKYGYRARARGKLQCFLKHGNVVFVATEGFRLLDFKLVKNIAIPFMWYKLLNLIKPTN